MNEKSTKKTSALDQDTLRAEYNREELGNGVRGKHYRKFQEDSTVVVLEPDVARAFPTQESVNEALRSLLHIAERTIKHPRHHSEEGG